jgi:putative ABC transport system substrate-binding protein
VISRRQLLGGLGTLAVPGASRAQTGRPVVVGFIGLASEAGDQPTLDAFRRGLAEVGRPEGPALRIVARHAGGDASRVGAMIQSLANIPVDVFLSPGPAVTRPLRMSTSIPIVAIGLPSSQSDPELFESLARPGGTLTGFASFGEELSAKRIEILKQAMPDLATVGVVHNATDRFFNEWGQRTASDAEAQGLRSIRLGLTSASPVEFQAHVDRLVAGGGKALIVVRDFLTTTMRDDICRLALAGGVAAVAEQREFAEAGALLSYGPDVQDLFRRAAGYVDRILKGERPSDLPIQLPSKLDLALNLRTAKTLRLQVPPLLLAQANDVID